MKYLKKYHFLVFPILFALFLSVATFLFKVENTFIKFGVTAALALVLSPRYRTHTTQSGEKTMVHWLFFKKSFEE